MRILFTAHAGKSHLRLLIPLAQAAVRAGHTVAVADDESMRGESESYGLAFFPAGVDWALDPDCVAAIAPGLWSGDQEAYEDGLVDCILGAPALRAARDIIAAAREWKPDLIVREGEEMGGYLAAEALGIPHVAVAGGSTHLLTPAVTHDRLNALRAELGLPADPDDNTAYRHLLVSWLPASWTGDGLDGRTLRHYRQTTPFRRDDPVLPWLAGLPDDKPVVYASIGTIAPSLPGKSDAVLGAVIEALSGIDCTAVVSIGVGRDPEDFGPVPDHVRLVTEWVPQDVLLEAADVFITHGGHSGIREGLRSGTPMLVTPMYDDQPHSAERCAALGCAIDLPAPFADAETVTAAVTALLTEPAYRRRAAAVRREILACPPVERLVADLEELVAATRTSAEEASCVS
ncbi:glycosyltransferase [Streptomyces sp. WI03-4A]|uniref:glycosyltransferase n=1 Tax=Streptomyces sp. WI03-4A TaxID=3028706 RepID=UPI0029B48ABD|nr:glycosyltransferase [Streptomyces sp. WI03-4A]MDX2596067.1 glycosyltransferase [Streptomyces sp. WI03-4A]